MKGLLMDIGIFLPTGTRGYLVSETAPLNEPTWALNRYVVQEAERHGCEFALSMVKLRGFGGRSRYWDAALEPFTLIAALAAVTSRIRLISTAASLVMPPAIVARMVSTMDQVAPGRIGLNLITGWQKAEYDQMGLWPGESHFQRRYEYLEEYLAVMLDLWSSGRSDRKGTFFQMEDCRLDPVPAHPIPLVVAGGSDKGLGFAARHCDFNFCAAKDSINQPEACVPAVRRLQAAAAAQQRDVRALVWVSVVADETDAAAEAKWQSFKAGTDLVALDWKSRQVKQDTVNADDPNASAARAKQGAEPVPTTTMKLIGSYATVARHLDAMAQVDGLAGAMLSFDDYRAGIDAFGRHIQPLMRSRAAATPVPA